MDGRPRFEVAIYTVMGVFWPVALLAGALYTSGLVGYKIVDWATSPSKWGTLLRKVKWGKLFRNGKVQSHEIIHGVTKPSIIAADMVVSALLRNPRDIGQGRSSGHFTCSKFSLSWQFDLRREMGPAFYDFEFTTPNTGNFKFEGDSEARLRKGLKKALDLRDDLLLADEAAKKEQQAVDVIEALTVGDKRPLPSAPSPSPKSLRG